MNRSRIAKTSIAFVAGLAVASCIVQAQPEETTTPVGPASAEAERNPDAIAASGAVLNVPDGSYSCTIDRYDPFPCQVRTEADGRKRLEKLAGSQRFSGVIAPTANGFSFRGTFYCPHGECTEAVSGDFVAYDDGLYRGKLSTRSNPTTVTVQYTQFGGYGYGGGVYGAMLYGGVGYGY